jgi:alkylation response protein AidB-like acyl-CoA dehydrogenase
LVAAVKLSGGKKLSVLAEQRQIKGGAFLTENYAPEETSTPEDFTEDQRMIAATTRQFVDNEIIPRTDELEQHNWQLARDLVRNAADLGLIGANIPAAYGGLGLDQTTGALIAENLGRSASFATTLGTQTGIGLLPIIHFGTEAAKQKYLPQIATGELITAYALTEAGSGSDALAARATARLSEDGTHYLINGEKMFVTNGGFADIFIVFAKVDGRKFTAFIVEAEEGVTRGAEERKMGIRGSSTTPLVLTDAKTPRENVLGQVGMGHQIAFGILNIGRCKLGAMCVGAMKLMVHEATRYANQRQQFGKSISSFGAIRAKLGEMAIRVWVGESMVYRTLGMMEIGAIEEYAAECSIVKVALSEYCNYVADEMVQIYGGYGYSADYPAERAYRDARINRIFEGTNEINRLLVSSRLLKPAMSQSRLAAAREFTPESGVLAYEWKLLQKAKRIVLTSFTLVAQMNKLPLSEQQVIMLGIADIIIDTFAMESAILRTAKLAPKDRDASCYLEMTQVFCSDAIQRIETTFRNTLAAIAEGDELGALLAAEPQLPPRNTVAARQRVAKALVEANAQPQLIR